MKSRIAPVATIALVTSGASAHVEPVTRGCLDGQPVESVAPVAPHESGAAPSVPIGSGAWQQMSVPAGVYLRAISMATPQVGYAAGELGKVLKTSDGGSTWQYVLNQGFPYYYYGCRALDAQTVVVSGFQNSSGEGIIRWTENGGATWGPVIALSGPTGIDWLAHVEFIDADHGMVEAAWSGGVHRTSSGGRTAADWTYVEPSGSWFSGTFTYLPDGSAWLAGIDIVYSANGGQNWSFLSPTGAIFDGPIALLPGGQGLIGGGTISPTVSGWVYGTTSGGQSWTPAPVLSPPYPVRGLMLLDEEHAWAVGGNVFTNAGGIWGTTKGGAGWALEQATGNEMNDLDQVRVDSQHVNVFAAGYVSQIWRRQVLAPLTPGDLDGDGAVGVVDFLALLASWGPCAAPCPPSCIADLDGDCNVGVVDMLTLLGNWS